MVSQNGAAQAVPQSRREAGLRVRLRGKAGNPDGIGAIARLVYGERLGPARGAGGVRLLVGERGHPGMGKDGEPPLSRSAGGRPRLECLTPGQREVVVLAP